MIFTSYSYMFFLLGVFFIYWSVDHTWQKRVLIIASYLFYCSWQWQFGFLLLGVSLFNWAYGRWIIPKTQHSWPVMLGILINLTPLVYFKYTAFFLTNLTIALNTLGGHWSSVFQELILPLGISFFTFQGIAYLVDVASGEEPFLSVADFLLFKAFWPQLIAGPIIRPGEIRSQIQHRRTFDYNDVAVGAHRILLGFFKKIVLADTLAPFVDMVFLPGATPHAVDSLFGTLGFGLQIYFDFSAYSDIAIGSARLFGFVFPENFDWPYLSRSPQEFWNRWHMTLSRWIRDYISTPLTFAARHHPGMAPFWLLVTMTTCGLWHGARWTFVMWGLWHGLLLVLHHTIMKDFFAPSAHMAQHSSYWQDGLRWTVTFVMIMLGWIFFRAETLSQAWHILGSIITWHGGVRPAILRENVILIVSLLLISVIMLQRMRDWEDIWHHDTLTIRALKPVLYLLLTMAVIVFDKEATAFVYFQF
ncbi:MAG: MBOAT family protein [Candidatus Tectimicrobiota bacterium]